MENARRSREIAEEAKGNIFSRVLEKRYCWQ
jgi:hypothetical protein